MRPRRVMSSDTIKGIPVPVLDHIPRHPHSVFPALLKMQLTILTLTSVILARALAQHGITAYTGADCGAQPYYVFDSSNCTSINAQINSFSVGHEFSERCIGLWFEQQHCEGLALAGFDAQQRGNCVRLAAGLSVQMYCR